LVPEKKSKLASSSLLLFQDIDNVQRRVARIVSLETKLEAMRIPRNFFRQALCVLTFLSSEVYAQPRPSARTSKVLDSGGPLIREQAAYDVSFYRLSITFDTTSKSISGSNLVRAVATDTLSTFVLDLNSLFTVESVVWRGENQFGNSLQFSRSEGRIWISLPSLAQSWDLIALEVYYHGTPKVSKNPPWDDGFVWKRTPAPMGAVWAGVACEEEGGDVWWPCKDHPSDEPDSVDLHFTVPASLTCVSNGKLLGVTDQGSTKTFRWYVSNPINNYNVTFYLGPLQRIPVEYRSVTGELIPSEYWFLPHNVDSAKKYVETFLKDLRFLEEVCGPFPFRADKYAIADAPYWGMEHQTIIAYGNNFRLTGYGFDYIHLHELAHEWWGNLVTAKDWSDAWIHEGFATYMEALFVERKWNFTSYRMYLDARRRNIRNLHPVAPVANSTAGQAFATNDIYYKGAWILHTLRYYLGDQIFFRLLRRFTYPDSLMESVTDGRQCWLATTDDYLRIAEQVSGKELDWFFNAYLRQAPLPALRVSKGDTVLTLRWVVPNGLPFYLPVEVQVGPNRVKVEMSSGAASLSIPAGSSYRIDPDGWILMDNLQIVSVETGEDPAISLQFDASLFPNPLNPTTTLRLEIPEQMRVQVEVVSLTGQRIAAVVDRQFEAGTHTVPVNLSGQSSGVYFLLVRGEERTFIRKMVLLR